MLDAGISSSMHLATAWGLKKAATALSAGGSITRKAPKSLVFRR